MPGCGSSERTAPPFRFNSFVVQKKFHGLGRGRFLLNRDNHRTCGKSVAVGPLTECGVGPVGVALAFADTGRFLGNAGADGEESVAQFLAVGEVLGWRWCFWHLLCLVGSAETHVGMLTVADVELCAGASPGEVGWGLACFRRGLSPQCRGSRSKCLKPSK